MSKSLQNQLSESDLLEIEEVMDDHKKAARHTTVRLMQLMLSDIKRLQGVEEKYESLKANVGKPTVSHYEHRVRAEKERDKFKTALELAMSENQSTEIYKEVQKIIKGADTK